MVKFPRKKKWNKPFSERIAKRVSRISSYDLTTWADQTIYEMSRLLGVYERTRTKQAADELVMGAEALHAVAEELRKRTTEN